MTPYEQYVRQPLSNTLGPLLRWFLEPLDRFLISLPPSVWLGCAIGLFVVAGIAVWTLKRDYVYLGAPDKAGWRDLRIWSTLLLIPYILVYLLLGL